MVATFKRGFGSVVSFAQLEGGSEFGPESAVRTLPGNLLPLYAYAPVPSALKRRYTRSYSSHALAIVPDIDTAMQTCPGSPLSDLSHPDCGWGHPATASSSSSLSALPELADALVVPSSPVWSAGKDGSLLETVLTALWDECASNGLFRYDLAECETRHVPGPLRFVAQLNEGRATKKRATEFRMDAVCQPFDPSKFNFTKAYVREVLFQFEPQQQQQKQQQQAMELSPRSSSGSLELSLGEEESRLAEASVCGDSPNLVVINVSPIEYGHVLLVPRVMDCLPQLVDASTVELALHFAKEADNASFRVGYNSLGAYASINHLHLQAYYLDAPFPCELAATTPILGAGVKARQGASVLVSRVAAPYPVNGFVVELDAAVPVSAGIAELARVVGDACVTMQRLNVPHNLLITHCGRRVYVWPQCFSERQAQGLIPESLLETGVNPAAFELSGHILLKRREDYAALGEAQVCELLAHASMPEERFIALAAACFGCAGAKGAAQK